MGAELALSAANAGSSILGTYANVGLNLAQNRWQRQHELKMYQMQRQDALADWERQNAYNHPAQQRQRLKEAGLNPNLVYGKGADVTAGSIRPSSMDMKQQIPLQIDTNAISRGFQSLMVAEKLDADVRIKNQQELLLMAQTAKEWSLVDKNGQQFKEMQDTYDIRLATMKAEQLLAESDIQTKDLERMKIGLVMAQIIQEMDVTDERRQPMLNQLMTQTELGRQALQLNLNKEQREKLSHQSDLKLALLEMNKIQEETLLIQSKQVTDRFQQQKMHAEIQNLYATRELIEANRINVLSKTNLTNLQSEWQSVRNDYQVMKEFLKTISVMSTATRPPAPAKTPTQKKYRK